MLLNKKTGLKILGVNFKDKKENALEFLQTLGNPYYLLAIDRDGRSSVNFGIYGIPESILVDKELTIIKKFIGPINSDNYQEIVKIVNNL
jgi:cytochrome c biogenesis protein CcmG/thiol:disulfide interchange protein DsbE